VWWSFVFVGGPFPQWGLQAELERIKKPKSMSKPAAKPVVARPAIPKPVVTASPRGVSRGRGGAARSSSAGSRGGGSSGSSHKIARPVSAASLAQKVPFLSSPLPPSSFSPLPHLYHLCRLDPQLFPTLLANGACWYLSCFYKPQRLPRTPRVGLRLGLG
jgi:hypothetical protein